MSFEMDFSTELHPELAGSEQVIKQASIKICSINYDIKNGIAIQAGVFSNKHAKRPIHTVSYYVSLTDEKYGKYFSSEAIKVKTILDAACAYLKSLPAFASVKPEPKPVPVSKPVIDPVPGM